MVYVEPITEEEMALKRKISRLFKKNGLKKVDDLPSPVWVTTLDEPRTLYEKFETRWGYPPLQYSFVGRHVHLGPIPRIAT